MQIKYTPMAAVVICMCLCGTSRATTDYASLAYVGDEITKKLPSNWRLVEKKMDEVPWGHYWGMKYTGPKGVLLVFEGSRDVFLHWNDKSGNRHQDALAKEILNLWIMPPDYTESWKRFFVMKRPISAELIYSGGTAKIYGMPDHRLPPEAEKKFNEILLTRASITSWPDSPQNTGTLSWTKWKRDIKNIFENN